MNIGLGRRRCRGSHWPSADLANQRHGMQGSARAPLIVRREHQTPQAMRMRDRTIDICTDAGAIEEDALNVFRSPDGFGGGFALFKSGVTTIRAALARRCERRTVAAGAEPA